MSLEIQLVSTLLGSLASSGIVDKVVAVLRERSREKGESKALESGPIVNAPQELDVLLKRGETTTNIAGSRGITLDAIAAAHDAAIDLRAERMRQARFTFNAALSLAVLGVLIIFSGVALLLFRDAVAPGALTASIGAVTEIVSAVLFKLNHETNGRLDDIGRDLSAIEAARIAMTLIEKIADPTKRDDAIKELAKDLRFVRSESNSSSPRATKVKRATHPLSGTR